MAEANFFEASQLTFNKHWSPEPTLSRYTWYLLPYLSMTTALELVPNFCLLLYFLFLFL